MNRALPQADPVVSDPTHLQNLNRYSYVLNNPFAYTDPTGFWGRKEQGYLRTAVSIVIACYTGYYIQAAGLTGTAAYTTAAMGGFASGAVASGTAKGALIGAFSAGVSYGIGSAWGEGTWENIGAHAVAGGITEELNGGRFRSGFIAAGMSTYLAPHINSGNAFKDGVANALVGGTSSVLTGGKFANGAVTAAFAYAFNKVAHEGFRGRNSNDEEAVDAIKPLKERAEEIVYREAGSDGVVDLSTSEFNEAFKYEAARFEMRSKLRGGYEKLSDIEFLQEAKNYGDSMFFGDNGGRLYRIGGRGPYLGGNINYVNQGLIFAIGNRSLDQALTAVTLWNWSGVGSSQYLDQRLDFTSQGYMMWKMRK